MTARAVYRDALPLLLSRRAAARLLGIDRCGAVMGSLVKSGRLALIPWPGGHRVSLEDVQRVAREGVTAGGRPARLRPSRKRTGTFDPNALRRLDVDAVKGGRP